MCCQSGNADQLCYDWQAFNSVEYIAQELIERILRYLWTMQLTLGNPDSRHSLNSNVVSVYRMMQQTYKKIPETVSDSQGPHVQYIEIICQLDNQEMIMVVEMEKETREAGAGDFGL